MSFRPDIPGGAGGGRATFTPTESPFADLAARDAWAAANLSSLFNSTTQVTEVVVAGDLYRWSGPNIPTSYDNTDWLITNNVLDAGEIKVLYESNPDTNAFDDTDSATVTSVQGVPVGNVPIGTSTGLAPSIVVQRDVNGINVDGEIESTKDTVFVGGRESIGEDGGQLKTLDTVENVGELVPGTVINTNGTTGDTQTVSRSNPSNSVIQGNDSETQAGDWVAWVPIQEPVRVVHNVTIRHVGTANRIRVILRDAANQTQTDGPILYQSHTEAQFAAGQGLTFSDGDNTIEFTNPNNRALGNSAKLVPGRFVYIEAVQADDATGTMTLRGATLDIGGITQFYAYLEQLVIDENVQRLVTTGDMPHPVTLRRDMPTETDAQVIVDSSLNNNSALWVTANDQLSTGGPYSGHSNRADATIVAQRAGFLDLDGNEIPTTPVAANTLELRTGTIVRIFNANDYRIVNSPVFEGDIPTPLPPVEISAQEFTINVGNYTNYLDRTIRLTNSNTGVIQVIRFGSIASFLATNPGRNVSFSFIVNRGASNQLADWLPAGGNTIGGASSQRRMEEETITIELPNSGSDWLVTSSFTRSSATVTDEHIRDLIGATLVAGTGIDIAVDDTGDTITINSTTGGVIPTPGPSSLYFGLSDSNNPATIDQMTLTNIDPTDPQTVTTGTTTANQYFIILTVNTHDITSIRDTVLNQDVTNIFTKTEDVRIIGGLTYDSYVIGPLNAGVSESYILNFS